MKIQYSLFLVLVAAVCSAAQAHFLWIVTDPATSQARVYFSEGAEPDDPDLLDRVADIKLHTLAGRDKTSELAVEKQGDALVASVGPAYGVALSRQYGVLDRGADKFLLHYHATSQASSIAKDWRLLGKEKLALEIVPAHIGDEIQLTVYWQGKPLEGAQIIAGGAGLEKVEGTTDAKGRFSVQPKKAGLLAVRARHVEATAGKLEDKAYDSVRHWTTLTVPVSPATMHSLATELPSVPKGITSFGAAITGDNVYVYGGHWGGAHHYWNEGQSNELLRLNVKGGKWETLASGPRRTGTAMVAHNGKLIRIGGFEALNAEADEADLHSRDDVQQYLPASNTWETLPALPAPRSSHDAAILGDTLYVVGGWNLQKRSEGAFHDTMNTLDLSSEKPEWKTVAVPFKRRALSVAAHGGKLYAIGGMKSQGGASTEVDVFDPKSGEWSKAPALHGQPMEGFGNTSFEIGGRLTAITMSGTIQQLSEDGKAWEINGSLKHPRFFARLLPLAGQGIVIAGADMGSGKVDDIELIGSR